MKSASNSKSGRSDHQRRHFFKRLVGEAISIGEEISGRPQMRTDALSQLPDAVINTMVPVVISADAFKMDRNALMLLRRRSGTYQLVGRLCPEQQLFMHLMDGKRTIAQIARQVSKNCQTDENKAYQIVRNFFCFLARYRVCIPKDAHSDGS